KTHWRIKTHLAISHLDVKKINKIVADMRQVLAKNPQVEQQRLHRRVFLDNINPENQALLMPRIFIFNDIIHLFFHDFHILVSCFVKTSHFEEYLYVKNLPHDVYKLLVVPSPICGVLSASCALALNSYAVSLDS
ncbi:hypothetical protein HN51_066277, partial [Arachis hypogaea]